MSDPPCRTEPFVTARSRMTTAQMTFSPCLATKTPRGAQERAQAQSAGTAATFCTNDFTPP
jgi:hypothetical protein